MASWTVQGADGANRSSRRTSLHPDDRKEHVKNKWLGKMAGVPESEMDNKNQTVDYLAIVRSEVQAYRGVLDVVDYLISVCDSVRTSRNAMSSAGVAGVFAKIHRDIDLLVGMHGQGREEKDATDGGNSEGAAGDRGGEAGDGDGGSLTGGAGGGRVRRR